VAVHAQTLDFIDNFHVIVTLLCARLCDLAAHVLEEILREAFLFSHVVVFVVFC
jgi:hypothetical protein